MNISSFVRLAGVAVLLAAAFSARADVGDGNVLLWMVYDNYEDQDGNPLPQVPDTSPTDLKFIDQLVSRPDGYSVNGARLRVDGTEVYLNIYASGADAPYANNLLPIAKEDGYFTQAGPVYSYLGDYGSADYSFLVELGHWEGDEWLVMAVSRVASYEELVEGGWTTDNLQNYPRHGPWSPGFAVPEPSGGLLMLLGASLLALRRRRLV